MYRGTTITFSLVAILALSACGGGGGSTADTTPSTNTPIDSPLSCSISQVNVTIDSLMANIKCEDKDGISSATAKIKSDDDTTTTITLSSSATSFDENITFGGLDDNTTYTIEASISSTDAKLAELVTQSSEYNITTLGVDAPIKDTQAPTLSSTSQTFTSTVGDAITLVTVTATDTVDGVVTVVQSGDTVDSNVAGTYNVIYTATDEANNSVSITHTYIVEALPAQNISITTSSGGIISGANSDNIVADNVSSSVVTDLTINSPYTLSVNQFTFNPQIGGSSETQTTNVLNNLKVVGTKSVTVTWQ